MVIFMETRMEKNRRIARQRRIRNFKFFILILVLFGLIYGLILVNQTVKAYNFFDDAILFSLDLKENEIIILGKKYYLDLKVLKRQF